jgi:hypothetical protein
LQDRRNVWSHELARNPDYHGFYDMQVFTCSSKLLSIASCEYLPVLELEYCEYCVWVVQTVSLSSSDVVYSISSTYTTLSGASNVAMNLLGEDSQLLEEFGVGSPPKSSLGSCIHDGFQPGKMSWVVGLLLILVVTCVFFVRI